MKTLFRFALLVWLLACGAVVAQDADQSVAQDADQSVAQDDDPRATSVLDPLAEQFADLDITTWAALAARAENLAETQTGSRFALTRVRSELVTWRDRFADLRTTNANRLATVADQIAALGAVPETGEDPPAIAARRDELSALKNRLRAPQTLAAEAFARANGLITEIDRRQRALETERLTKRSASPAKPAAWPDALFALQSTLAGFVSETWSIGGAFAKSGGLLLRIIVVIIALIAAAMVLTRARAWVTGLTAQPIPAAATTAAGLRFALSLIGVVLPVIGLFLVVTILELSGLFGINGRAVLGQIPLAGMLIFGAKWLADYYFPTDADDDGILGYDADTRVAARRITNWLGWAMGVFVMLDAVLGTADIDTVALDVLNLPFQIIVGVLLWRLGKLVVRHARPDTQSIFVRSRLRVFIGRAAQLFGVAGPLASVLGYGAAANAITIPAVASLAVVATTVVLQRLSYAVATPDAARITADPEDLDPKGLLPVSINLVLTVLSLPVLALIWGVSIAELAEVWTRFLAGFSIGETQISPAIFLSFVIVFMLGMLITRFIKTTLQTSVMPRTNFDLGGQNAVVAGFGYVGVFISALVAFGVAGIDLSSLAIVAGALSVGIGFGLQNIVSNFVSGIILLIERPVGEGDMIEVGGQMGYVRDISVRSTRIETFDKTDVIVPNADLVSNQVTNWTRGNAVGRAIVPVGVAYGTDKDQVMAILREVAESNPLVLLNPPPAVLMIGFGADSIDFEIRAIIRDVNFALSVKSEMLQMIVERFDEAGIEIPFAQRDIWLRNPEALQTTKDDAT